MSIYKTKLKNLRKRTKYLERSSKRRELDKTVFTGSKVTTETTEQCLKSVQS